MLSGRIKNHTNWYERTRLTPGCLARVRRSSSIYGGGRTGVNLCYMSALQAVVVVGVSLVIMTVTIAVMMRMNRASRQQIER